MYNNDNTYVMGATDITSKAILFEIFVYFTYIRGGRTNEGYVV